MHTDAHRRTHTHTDAHGRTQTHTDAHRRTQTQMHTDAHRHTQNEIRALTLTGSTDADWAVVVVAVAGIWSASVPPKKFERKNSLFHGRLSVFIELIHGDFLIVFVRFWLILII